MRYGVYDAATGEPIYETGGTNLDPNVIPLQPGEAIGKGVQDAPFEEWWFDPATGEATATTRIDLDPFASGPAPLTLDMTALPAGALVRATNNAGTSVETSDPADPIRLTTPGVYAVRVEPPFPYRTLAQEVTVDA